MPEKENSDSRKIFLVKKVIYVPIVIKLMKYFIHCESFHLNFYMIICLIQFSMLGNLKSVSRKISQMKKDIYVVIVSVLELISFELLDVNLFDSV